MDFINQVNAAYNKGIAPYDAAASAIREAAKGKDVIKVPQDREITKAVDEKVEDVLEI